MSEDIDSRSKSDNIELLNEDVQEILGKVPPRIVRSGMTVVIIIIAVIGVFATFFTYPDYVRTQIVLVSENPSIEVLSKVNGNVDSLYVFDNEVVKKGQLLAVIANTAKYQDICLLQTSLNAVYAALNSQNQKLPHLPLNPLELGMVTNSYTDFLLVYEKLNAERQMADRLQRLSASPQIIELRNLTIQKLTILFAAIKEWRNTFLLCSPISGKVSFNDILSEQKYVTNNKPMFIITPLKKKSIIGRIKLPLSEAGKIFLGQKVRISVDNYPYLEFGKLEGTIQSISDVPQLNDNGEYYNVQVRLSRGLITNQNKHIELDRLTLGDAEIITREESILARILKK